MYRNPVIAHISDLHFGRGNHNDEVAKVLREHLVQTKPRPDFIVATGDLTQFGLKSEMRAARAFLDGVLDDLWQQHQHVARCIVIPGNHDLLPTRWKGLIWWRSRKHFDDIFSTWSFTSELVPKDRKRDHTPASLEEYFATKGKEGNDAEKETCKALRYCEYFPAFHIAFLKLDSNTRSFWWPGAIARGAVGDRQLAAVGAVMEHYENAFPATAANMFGFADARRIALVHHHVTHLPNVQYEASMLMLDAGNVWRHLASADVDLLLHGHRHYASQVGIGYWDPQKNQRRLNILSAGSATARDVDDKNNTYYRIEVDHFGFRLRHLQITKTKCEELGDKEGLYFKMPFTARPSTPEPIYQHALESMLEPDEPVFDRNHHYEEIAYHAFIDQNRNYHGCFQYRGVNVSDQETLTMPFSVVVVGAQPFSALNVTAFDLHAKKPLDVRPSGRPMMRYPAQVWFAQPLPPEGKFHIEISLKLPEVMFQGSDFDAFSLVPFTRGVDRLEYQVLSDHGLYGPQMYAVGRRVSASVPGLKPIENEDMAFMDAGKSPLKGSGFKIAIEKPQALGYVFFYQGLQKPQAAVKA